MRQSLPSSASSPPTRRKYGICLTIRAFRLDGLVIKHRSWRHINLTPICKKNSSQARLRIPCLSSLFYLILGNIKNTASYNSFLSLLLIAQTKPVRNWVTHSQGLNLHGNVLFLRLRIQGSCGCCWPHVLWQHRPLNPGRPQMTRHCSQWERSLWAHRDGYRSITTTEPAVSRPPVGGSMALTSSVKDGSSLHLTELSPDPEHWGWVIWRPGC